MVWARRSSNLRLSLPSCQVSGNSFHLFFYICSMSAVLCLDKQTGRNECVGKLIVRQDRADTCVAVHHGTNAQIANRHMTFDSKRMACVYIISELINILVNKEHLTIKWM